MKKTKRTELDIKVGSKVKIAIDNRKVATEKKSNGQEAIYQGWCWTSGRHRGKRYLGSQYQIHSKRKLNRMFLLGDGQRIFGTECFWEPVVEGV